MTEDQKPVPTLLPGYELAGNLRLPRQPISDDEIRYFSTKGPETQRLWGRRLGKGLTVAQREELDRRIREWKAGRES